MNAELKSTRHGHTMVLTISNPAHRNALAPEIYAAGVEALSVAESNPEVRSVILTGEGRLFSPGSNLQYLQHSQLLSPQAQTQDVESFHNWIESIRTFPKPVIAAIEGAAAGDGLALALACDFIVAASNAVFVTAYSPLALSPAGGASWNLMRALPRQYVSELLMLGDRIGAQRLHAMGLVNQIAESGGALSEALALAERLNARARNSLASIKELLSEASSNSLNQQLALERDHFVRNLQHPNAAKGIRAYLEKKAAAFE